MLNGISALFRLLVPRTVINHTNDKHKKNANGYSLKVHCSCRDSRWQLGPCHFSMLYCDVHEYHQEIKTVK